MLVPDHLKEEGALLRLLGQHMTPIVCGSDDPAVIATRTGFVAIDCRRPSEPAAGHKFRHSETHRKANSYPAISGSERQFRLTGQDLDLIFGRKVALMSVVNHRGQQAPCFPRGEEPIGFASRPRCTGPAMGLQTTVDHSLIRGLV